MLQLELNNGSMGSELPLLQPLTPWEHQAGGCFAWTRWEPKAKVLLLQIMTHMYFWQRCLFGGDGSRKSVNGRQDSAGFTD